MKIELEREDLKHIAKEVAEMLKPLLAGNNKKDDVIFDVGSLSEYLIVSKRFIYERIHRNEIPYYKVGGLLRFSKKDIDNWLKANYVPSTK
ncbi:helix-turn-helix domain protein [bacterium BMS3Abin10]|nr:helix-turn-helix domain protein [bacterium BMS3Abin10]GBE38847.1 helix-turn-helix domain protein [bacterium BMS3Bbin08]